MPMNFRTLQEVLDEYMSELAIIRNLREGMEWTDGWFNYIAYNKADGSVAVRDAEGFDYSGPEWAQQIVADRLSDNRVMQVADTLSPEERIARWLAAGGTLDR